MRGCENFFQEQCISFSWGSLPGPARSGWAVERVSSQSINLRDKHGPAKVPAALFEEGYGRWHSKQTLESLRKTGHEVDACVRKKLGPCSRHDQLAYHDDPGNIELVKSHVDRVKKAKGPVLVVPIWNFGFPAILKVGSNASGFKASPPN